MGHFRRFWMFSFSSIRLLSTRLQFYYCLFSWIFFLSKNANSINSKQFKYSGRFHPLNQQSKREQNFKYLFKETSLSTVLSFLRNLTDNFYSFMSSTQNIEITEAHRGVNYCWARSIDRRNCSSHPP